MARHPFFGSFMTSGCVCIKANACINSDRHRANRNKIKYLQSTARSQVIELQIVKVSFRQVVDTFHFFDCSHAF